MQRAELVWERSQTPFLTDRRARDLGVRVVFTSRRGGHSRAPFDSLNLSPFIGDSPETVASNHASLEDAAGFDKGGLTLLKQVHGKEVRDVSGAPGLAGEGDGLFYPSGTTAPGPRPVLGVLSADCVPVLIKGENGVAAAHAGWRGLVAGIIEAAVERVGRLEAAWIGPSIHACCYEVGTEVLDAFEARDLPIAGRGADGHGRVSPGRAAAVILHRLGAPYLVQTSICTSCDEDFFSFRRDGLTGRQGGFITTA